MRIVRNHSSISVMWLRDLTCYRIDAMRYQRYHTTLFVAVCVAVAVAVSVALRVAVPALLPIGFQRMRYTSFKRPQNAFSLRTRHTSGHLYIIRGTLPCPALRRVEMKNVVSRAPNPYIARTTLMQPRITPMTCAASTSMRRPGASAPCPTRPVYAA